jgi:hypothetical protein
MAPNAIRDNPAIGGHRMRYIGPVLAGAAVRFLVDATLPPKGVLQRDLIPYLTDRYQFNIFPPTGPGVAAAPILTFMSGILDPTGDRIPIVQATIFNDSLLIVARETSSADRILDDMIGALTVDFHYNFSNTVLTRMKLSQVSVEFDERFVRQIGTFQVIGALLNNALDRTKNEYLMKRLLFGRDSVPTVPPGTPITDIEQVMLEDFGIERRAGATMESNLFFCSAPMATHDHIALLERIESECLRSLNTTESG